MSTTPAEPVSDEELAQMIEDAGQWGESCAHVVSAFRELQSRRSTQPADSALLSELEALRRAVNRCDENGVHVAVLAASEARALLSELERLKAALAEERAAVRDLQREACARDGVPMPSERPVVDKLRAELERMREALRALASDEGFPYLTNPEKLRQRISFARSALSTKEG